MTVPSAGFQVLDDRVPWMVGAPLGTITRARRSHLVRFTVPLLAVASLGFAPLPFPKPDPSKKDLQRMQGAWVLVDSHRDGRHDDLRHEAVWVIEGHRLTISLDGTPERPRSIALDGRTAPPSLDLGPGRPGDHPLAGRYRVDGDTLTVRIGVERPADLSGRGPGNGVWVFKRRKP
jgi:uncharacterized protein (TIGR03067 family)